MSDDKRVTRRKLLRSGTTVGLAIAAAGMPAPTQAAPAFDPEQRFLTFVGGDGGVLYGVQADGALLWFRHLGRQDGSAVWANGGNGRQIGTGWHQFHTVLAGADGRLFGVRGDGTVCGFEYVVDDPATGAGSWLDGGSAKVVGEGFDRFPRIFGGWHGVLYCVDAEGALHRSQLANGRLGDPVRMGAGFKPYIHLMAGPGGIIYGVRQGQTLHWWAYRSGAWANGGNPIKIGTGWGDGAHKQIVAADDGVLYAIRLDPGATPGRDDTLVWYRLANADRVDQDGSARWDNGGSGKAVGSGFCVEPGAALQGYPDKLGVPAGSTLSVPVSTTFASYTASVVRLAPDVAEVRGPSSQRGALQLLPEGYRENGCGWTDGVAVPVPTSWPSGVYAVRLTGPHGLRRHVPFVVRPAAPAARLAVLLPTTTYHAYNWWAGHNQYSAGQGGLRRVHHLHRPSTSVGVEPDGRINHTLYSDLILLRWMRANTFTYDCYTDTDLHADPSWLARYSALVLGSHPEYWSSRMREALVAYLDGGGRLVYTGGNGIYEQVDMRGDAVVFRDEGGARNVWRNDGAPEWEILGGWLGGAYMNFAPYTVVNDHPLLAGTGLRPGDAFGHVAYNGGASGWEVDVLPPGGSPGAHLIAEGANAGGGAAMLFVEKPHGGWVFSAGSMSFNGALPHNPPLARILKNALDKALG
ncbi:N,N-dimethylformamidase beta subunit family domain-containing protein [Nonomuraea sp. NPDC046802]|uniref:N,N-dimethylformamidase beta subunit family domain-containing protein n=1 Tax=Nonomuraea sp. NPDC046802 TaxID=3154919 RepID=UPI003409A12E